MYVVKVLTWNVGTDADYTWLLHRKGLSVPDDNDEIFEMRDNLLQKIFQKHSPHFLLLQEVGNDMDRCRRWIGEKYAFISDTFDSLVAYKMDQFIPSEVITYPTNSGKTYTILKVRDYIHDKVIKVASAHISGFNLETTESAGDGNHELESLVSDMERDTSDLMIIGLDANTTPNYYQERLDILETRNYKRDFRDNTPTNYNVFIKEEVKLDYIYTKGNGSVNFVHLPHDLKLEDPENNPSDHIPVIKEISSRS